MKQKAEKVTGNGNFFSRDEVMATRPDFLTMLVIVRTATTEDSSIIFFRAYANLLRAMTMRNLGETAKADSLLGLAEDGFSTSQAGVKKEPKHSWVVMSLLSFEVLMRESQGWMTRAPSA